MTRTIPATLAPIIEELELEQPRLVTIDQLSTLVAANGIRTSVKVVAARLRQHGWLLPTTTAGVWEFAPGAHAGPVGHGDPLIEIKAFIAGRPAFELVLTGASALAAHNLLDRNPDAPHVAISPDQRVPPTLRRLAMVSRYRSELSTVRLRGLPTHRVASVLVLAASHPTHLTSWAAIVDRLGDIIADCDLKDLSAELEGRPAATRARLAYLVHGVDPQLADELLPPPNAGDEYPAVWFGSRKSGRSVRASRRFGVRDSLLPFHPGEIQANPGRTRSRADGPIADRPSAADTK
ncbi:hypothetical protein JYT71_00010 [Acidimicrobiaceae bacterium AH-315-P05]|nr:hypothetical protein [Acidimicrobiaceae bacterium AH-315-P05]